MYVIPFYFLEQKHLAKVLIEAKLAFSGTIFCHVKKKFLHFWWLMALLEHFIEITNIPKNE